MLMKELIGSCSIEPVAEAAVMSIGPIFFTRVAGAAERQRLSVGAYAARAVRNFADTASEADWSELRSICSGTDMPVLRALHHILQLAMDDEQADRGDWRHFGSSAIGKSAAHCRQC